MTHCGNITLLVIVEVKIPYFIYSLLRPATINYYYRVELTPLAPAPQKKQKKNNLGI